MDVQIENVMPDGFRLERQLNVMHGMYNGIVVLVIPERERNQYQVQLHVKVENSLAKQQFLDYLGALRQIYSCVVYAGYNGMDTVSLSIQSEEQKDKDNLDEVISSVTAKCTQYGLHSCCTYCKSVETLNTASVDGVPVLLCQNCLTRTMSEANEQAHKKENIPLGILGAAIGVLLGAVLWVIIGQVGFIAGIAGYVIVLCGMKGYQMLGKGMSKAGVVICVLLSALVIIGAEYVSLGLIVYKELKDVSLYSVSMGDAFGMVPMLLEEPEVIGGVVKDLAVGYILAVWASFSLVRSQWKLAGQEAKTKTVVRF